MTMIIAEETPRFAEMEQVVELYVKNVNPTAIAKQVGIRRVDVLNHIEEWRKSAVGSEVMRERVEELISAMDRHYSDLITKAYEVVDEVDQDGYEPKGRSQMLGQKLAAIRAIADFEAKRVDVLQKAGLLDAADLGDELAEMERQKELILTIFDEELCKSCSHRVKVRLAGELGKGTVVVVDG